MRRGAAVLVLAVGSAIAAPAVAQPGDSVPATLNDIAESQRALVRQRAVHCYRMPDGTIWDGWNYKQWREVLDHNLKAFDRMERGHGDPGQTLVEDRRVGTVWKFKLTPDARAWGLISNLANEAGELREQALETANPSEWKDAPPLWSCALAPEYTWSFAYFDEQDPDAYTQDTHKGYLEITRDLGQGRFEFKGYSLDRGAMSGQVYIDEPAKFLRKDRFKGRFFLWEMGNGGGGDSAWKLLPADQIRVSPDALAEAILNGKAQIVVWTYERVKDKVIWKRTVRDIELARIPQPIVDKPGTSKPPPPIPGGGPDLVVLNDGRWFRGKIVKKDDASLTIRTMIGQSEMDMVFKMDEVKEFQAPEKRP